MYKCKSAEHLESHADSVVNSPKSKAQSDQSFGLKQFDDVFDRLLDDSEDNRKQKRSGTWPRTRSLNAPSPVQHFGPCGRIMKNSAMVMTIQDPASQRLTWYKPPLSVLVIKKARDASVYSPFVKLVQWLIEVIIVLLIKQLNI
ncbi:unnamed protein product [Ceutorhynchus assimilis]|uniref:Uncharacterized protein n=1 Tax=Ceutorhynchus assimilis TaxID=467358 RepID=A0A9P0GVG5_9CUCU|nr:unnamed protein product [Ceutorhynchus assimilis]